MITNVGWYSIDGEPEEMERRETDKSGPH